MIRTPVSFGGRDLLCAGTLLALTGLAFHQLLLPVAGQRYALGGDVASYFYPVRRYVLTEFMRGTVPLWTPYMGFGFPLAADIEAAVFYPPGLLLGLLLGSSSRALELQFSLHVALGGVGMYLFCRHLGSARPGALFAGSAWLLSGVLWAHSAHLSIIQSAAWLPLVLWAFDRALATLKVGWAAVAGVLFAMVFLGGHPQVAAYVMIALVVWGGLHARPLARNGPGPARVLGFFAVTLITAFGLAALQLIPTVELSRISSRYRVGEAFLFEEALPPGHLLTLFLPLAFQGTGGWRSVDEFHAYMGVAPLLLAGVALLRGRGPRTAAAAILVVLAIPLALGLYRPLVGWIPGLDFFRVPARALLLFDFVVALLAGLGVDVVSRQGLGRSCRAVLLGVPLLALSAWAALALWRPALPRLSPTLASQVGWFAIFCVASALIIVVAQRVKEASWPVVLLIGLLALDQLSLPRTIMWSRTPAEEIWAETEVTTHLKGDPGLFRVWSDGIPYGWRRFGEANPGLVHRIQATSVYSSFDPIRSHRFFAHFGKRLSEFPHLLDLLNIKYLVTSSDLGARMMDRLRGGEPRYERLAPTLWLNRSALPRAFLVGAVEVISSRSALFERLETLDPRRSALIERREPECSPLEGRPLDNRKVGMARIIEYAPTRVRVEAELREPGALVVSDAHYPGWTVWVNGARRSLLRANFLFRAVCLPPGHHLVEMTFEPRAFWVGLAMTLGTLGGLGAGAWVGWRRRAGPR